ncbi:hypothetical protein KCP75_07655 [Salmonella enterica subsp. enterica]|nr:hypothetical protein KCP75_07655 [Salmonella enterica subsp. enterica]
MPSLCNNWQSAKTSEDKPVRRTGGFLLMMNYWRSGVPLFISAPTAPVSSRLMAQRTPPTSQLVPTTENGEFSISF